MTIEEELRALILLNSLPSSRETFVMTICNASFTEMTYPSTTGTILSKDARRKSFEHNRSGEAYAIQEIGGRHHRNRSSSRGPSTSRSRSKSHDKRMSWHCNEQKFNIEIRTCDLLIKIFSLNHHTLLFLTKINIYLIIYI